MKNITDKLFKENEKKMKTTEELLKLLPASFQSTHTYETCKECHYKVGVNFFYELIIKGSSDSGCQNRKGSNANVYEIYYQEDNLYGHKPKKIRIDVCQKYRDLREGLEDFYNFVKEYHPEVFKNY